MNLKFAAWFVVLATHGILAGDCWASAPIKVDVALAAFGSIQDDFQISSDGNWVVYRADRNTDEMYELYCVASNGGTPIKLNGTLVGGGDVDSWQFSPDGSRAIYWADQQHDKLTEVYVVPTAGGASLKLNSPLVDVGSTGGAIVGDRVAYIASERTNVFFEPYFELFSAPSAGGAVERLSGEMVAGADVLSAIARAGSSRVVYLADQEVLSYQPAYQKSASSRQPFRPYPWRYGRDQTTPPASG